jgi:hypothetical protein
MGLTDMVRILWTSIAGAKKLKGGVAMESLERMNFIAELNRPSLKSTTGWTYWRRLTGQHTGRQRVKDAAADSALGEENIVEWAPAVSRIDRAPACLRQTSWRDGRPGSRPAGVNSVSSPG